MQVEIRIGERLFEKCSEPVKLAADIKRCVKELLDAEEALKLAESMRLPESERVSGVKCAADNLAGILLDMFEMFAGIEARNAAYEALNGNPAKICAAIAPFFTMKLLPNITECFCTKREELLGGRMNAFERDEMMFLGRRVKLDLRYLRVRGAYAFWREELLTDAEMINASLDMLVKNKHVLRGMSMEQRWLLLERIFRDFVAEGGESGMNTEKVFDFIGDEDYIYTSLLAVYGIDIYAKRNLHWRRFLALIRGLPEESRLREVIGVRTAKIPERTEFNGAEVDELIRLKAYYSPELTTKERERQFGLAVERLAGALERAADMVG